MTIFSPRAVNIIETFSKDEARRICSSVIQPEHIVLSILKKQNGLGFELLKQLKIDIAMLQEELERNLISNEENKKDSDYLAVIPMGRRTKSLIDIATIEAQTLENKYVGTEHLILACVRETDSITAKFFEKEGISLSSARLLVRTIQKNFKSSYISNSISDKKVDSKFTENNELNKIKELLSDGNDLFSNQNFSLQRDDEEKDNKKNQFGNYENQSFLAEYSRDIT